MLEKNLVQHPPWLVTNSVVLCYEGKPPTGTDIEKKLYFLQHVKKHTNSDAYTDGYKSEGKKESRLCSSIPRYKQLKYQQ